MATKTSDVFSEFTVPALDILEYAKREGCNIKTRVVEKDGGPICPLCRVEVLVEDDAKCRIAGYFGNAWRDLIYEFEILGCVFQTKTDNQSTFGTYGKDIDFGPISPSWFWGCLKKYVSLAWFDPFNHMISSEDYSDDDIIAELERGEYDFAVYALDEDLDVCAFGTVDEFNRIQGKCRNEFKCGYSRITKDFAFKVLAHRRPGGFEVFYDE